MRRSLQVSRDVASRRRPTEASVPALAAFIQIANRRDLVVAFAILNQPGLAECDLDC
jgi:hypothetical protein